MGLTIPLRLTLGIILLSAGAEKLRNLNVFIAGVLQYKVLPDPLAQCYARLLPIVEVGIGGLLLLHRRL